MPTSMIFISGKGALYGYTAEAPQQGGVITPDTTDRRVKIESVDSGEDGLPQYFGVIRED